MVDFGDDAFSVDSVITHLRTHAIHGPRETDASRDTYESNETVIGRKRR